MPYTPPSHGDPTRLAVDRLASSVTNRDRGSSSAFTANETAANGPVTNSNLAAGVETHHSHEPSAHSSDRQSPPRGDNHEIPPGGILSPSDSDDEVSGEDVRSLKELREALLRINVEHSLSRDNTTETPINSLPATSYFESLPTKPGKISQSPSASAIALPQYAVSSVNIEPSEGSDAENELRRKAPLLMKQSGELVKPVLRPSSRRRPLSMPSTPTYPKAVHFAYGSETEPNYDDGHQPKRQEWEIKLSSFPSESSEKQTMPVRLERIFLTSDRQTLVGTVACADIAPQKLVICRFTLDHWITNFEVVAEYYHGLRKKYANDGYSRFNFKIQLNDHENLEFKTMLLCVRYNVSGHEYWDGNGPTNYQVDFIKKVYPKETSYTPPNHYKPDPESSRIFFDYPSPATVESNTQDTPDDHSGIKSEPGLDATHIPIMRSSISFTEKEDLQLAVTNEIFQNSCYPETLTGKDSPNAQMALGEGIALPEEKISANYSVLEHEESNLEGSTLLDTDESLTAGVEQQAVLDSTKGTDDYMSLPSNDEDITSQATRQRTEQEILAVKLFGLFFAESVELSHLHKSALGKLGPSRFLENYRRILKTYVLKLRVEARTALEKDAVKVIESRRNRRSIAKHIIALLAPESEETLKPLDELAHRPLMKQNLEDWARTVYGLPDAIPDHAPEQAEYSSEESDEEEGGKDDNENRDKEHLKTLTYTNIEKAYHFLHQNIPFQTVVLQLRLLELPAYLREIIESSPKRSIKISAKNDTSLMNRAKAIAESYTATQWDWWPLAPRVPDTTPDRLRLEWEFCRQPLYNEISLEEAESIRHIMDISDEHPAKCHCCKVPSSQLDWPTAFRLLFKASISRLLIKFANPSSTGITSPSKAHLRYTPSTNSTSTGTQPSLGAPQGTSNLTPNSPSYGNAGSQGQPNSRGGITSAGTFWVVFGIKNMRGFNAIENIETHVGLEDTSFFQDMRRRHGKHRWFFQRWFSPYRFRYCRFVQFERIIVDEVSSCQEALPDDYGYTIDYKYRPRPPAAKKPLIDPARFSILLKTCNGLCYWSLLPKFLHKCRRLPVDSQEWLRIPQKKGIFDTAFESYNPSLQLVEKIAFGIEADYLPSSAFFFFYHAILILSGFSFWIYWLKEHPGDLQNASVPLFTLFALIAAFWAFVGKGVGAS